MKKKTILWFLLLLLCFLSAVSQLDYRRQAEGKRQLEQLLRRTAVSCYASEGFYPPDVAYMEDHYGVSFDENAYIVRYELFASNWMPDITVLERTK